MLKPEPGNCRLLSHLTALASNLQKKQRLVPLAAQPGLRLSHDVDDNKWLSTLAAMHVSESFGLPPQRGDHRLCRRTVAAPSWILPNKGTAVLVQLLN